MTVRSKGLAYLKRMLAEKTPSLRLVFWDGDVFDFASDPRVVVTLKSRSLWRSLLRGDFFALSDAYVAGDLLVEGAPDHIISVGVALAERLEKSFAINFFIKLAASVPRRRSIARDVENIRRHYDVSNEFYKLWLDELLVYSCAYFEHESDSLDVAQQRKLDHVCRKLMMKPGDRFLDVGCGWGALPCRAAERYGALAYGITLSELQFEEAKRRTEGASANAKIALMHFRELQDDLLFEKIASVGMYEHVGTPGLSSYFRKMAALLKPGGLFLNHGIISTGSRSGPSGGAFIERYVFPGGSVASLSTLVAEITSAGLEVIDIEDLRPHYARTLRLWSQRLEQSKECAIEISGAEAYRIYRVYLAGMAHAFERGWLSIAQVLALKPESGKPARRVWTRAHQYVQGNSECGKYG